MTPPPPLLALPFLLLLCLPAAAVSDPTPTPTPWPPQFHAKLLMDYRGNLSLADLWYDWPGGRNLHVIRYQLAASARYYDAEWNNGTSFFYTPARRQCRSAALGVGILRPDWLSPGALYLGRVPADGFDCHAWAKADFITYYEDARTRRPVKWVFYTGRTAHVMSFEVGAVLEDSEWQAPDYCFTEDDGAAKNTLISEPDEHHESFIPNIRMFRVGELSQVDSVTAFPSISEFQFHPTKHLTAFAQRAHPLSVPLSFKNRSPAFYKRLPLCGHHCRLRLVSSQVSAVNLGKQRSIEEEPRRHGLHSASEPRRRRRRGVEEGGGAEGRRRGPGPCIQGGGRLHAAAVPARPRPQHRQGVGDVPQVRELEAGGEAPRRHHRRRGPQRARAGQALHAGLRQARAAHDLRLRRPAPPRQARPRRVQALRRLRPRQNLHQVAGRAREVRGGGGPEGLGVRELRHPGVRGGAGHHAELLPGEAGEGVPGPRAAGVHGGVEDGLPVHRRQHQEEVRVRLRQGPRRHAPGRHRRVPAPRGVRREAQAAGLQLAGGVGQLIDHVRDNQVYN